MLWMSIKRWRGLVWRMILKEVVGRMVSLYMKSGRRSGNKLSMMLFMEFLLRVIWILMILVVEEVGGRRIVGIWIWEGRLI